MLISGHFANYEVMAAVIAASGLDCRVTYRAANNPYVDRRIIATSGALRRASLFAPKGGDGLARPAEDAYRAASPWPS